MLKPNPRCGDEENSMKGKFGKLNQWKVCINHYVLLSAERSSHTNVLKIEISSSLNVETEPRMKWCGDGETTPMENLPLGNGMAIIL